MSYKNTNSSRLLLLLLVLVDVSSSCDPSCGGIKIPYPFGVGERCALEKSYVIECRNKVPFLSLIDKEVVSFSPPSDSTDVAYRRYSSVRVKNPITSEGCSKDGKDSKPTLNLTGTPFFVSDVNSLVAVGCGSKASLVGPTMVGCTSKCSSSSHDSDTDRLPFSDLSECSADNTCPEKNPEEARCDGNGCCEVTLPNLRQAIDIKIESGNEGNSTCRVAFLTDELYSLSNATKAERLFENRFATVELLWFIHTKNDSFLNFLGCKNTKDHQNSKFSAVHKIKCICQNSIIPEYTFANCGCIKGYTGYPYTSDGCGDVNECQRNEYFCKESETCENTVGGYYCKGDKTKPILIGVGAGLGVLVVVGGAWWLRKTVIKRRITKRKKKFFKRNGGLLLQQKLNTREDNVERMKVFTSKELEKATESFSENRVLGHGGQGTVYKGMLVDGRTVAVKKSKAIDEDKLQEFINEVVILSQINHRHVVKLLGCCLETDVPILVYEFVLNGSLFQHIHEESNDYAMVWGVRLRIAVDIAGALSYLHSYASSPIYHRDIKSMNILLDEKYRAKVSDFGTSRSVTIDQTHWTTLISGTVGYVDPEYYKSSQYTEKSDVYSFGVVLAELISGDKPVIMVQDTGEIISLVEHFKDAMKEKRFFEILDPRIRDECKPEQVMAVANLAMKCLKSKGKNRPNMREVFTELEKICTSPEDLQLQTQVDEEEDEEEEEFMNIMSRSESWSIGVTAPASSIVAPSSCSDDEPLFPRLTC